MIIPDLHRVVYVSRASAWVADIDVILIASRAAAWNSRNGVTGLLLYDGVRFLQAIEGDRTIVAALMDRIRTDDRHKDLRVSIDGPANHRTFGNWAMQYRDLSAEPSDEAFLNAVKNAVAPVDDLQVKALFIGFAALNRRRE